jgi:hypothetical protein
MGNDDLLQQFKKLLEENNKQQDENFQKRLDAAVDPLHERLNAQREQITSVERNLSEQITRQGKHIATVKMELTEKIDQQTHDVADILSKAVMPDIDRHETQIAELQKAVGLRPKQ